VLEGVDDEITGATRAIEWAAEMVVCVLLQKARAKKKKEKNNQHEHSPSQRSRKLGATTASGLTTNHACPQSHHQNDPIPTLASLNPVLLAEEDGPLCTPYQG